MYCPPPCQRAEGLEFLSFRVCRDLPPPSMASACHFAPVARAHKPALMPVQGVTKGSETGSDSASVPRGVGTKAADSVAVGDLQPVRLLLPCHASDALGYSAQSSISKFPIRNSSALQQAPMA